MKQTDIFSIILVAGVGTIVAFFVCRALMGDPSNAKVEFTVLKKNLNSSLVDPDPEIFNSLAINPTIEVYVGECEDLDKNGILDDTELASCTTAKEKEEEAASVDAATEKEKE